MKITNTKELNGLSVKDAIEKHRLKNGYLTSDGRQKKPQEQRVKEITDLTHQGYRSDQIADILDIGRDRILTLASKNGIKMHDKQSPMRKIDVRRVVEETVNGLSGYAIGLQTVGELKDVLPDDAQTWAESLGESLKPINKLHKKLKEVANGS